MHTGWAGTPKLARWAHGGSETSRPLRSRTRGPRRALRGAPQPGRMLLVPQAGPAGMPRVRGEGLAGEAGEEVSGAGYVRGGSPGDPPTTESWGEADLLPCFLGWRA